MGVFRRPFQQKNNQLPQHSNPNETATVDETTREKCKTEILKLCQGSEGRRQQRKSRAEWINHKIAFLLGGLVLLSVVALLTQDKVMRRRRKGKKRKRRGRRNSRINILAHKHTYMMDFLFWLFKH